MHNDMINILLSCIKDGSILFQLSNQLLSYNMQYIVSNIMHNSNFISITSPFSIDPINIDPIFFNSYHSHKLYTSKLNKLVAMNNNFEDEIESIVNFIMYQHENLDNPWRIYANNAFIISLILAWIMSHGNNDEKTKHKINYCKIQILHWLSVMIHEIEDLIVNNESSISESEKNIREANFLANNFIVKLYGLIPKEDLCKIH